MLLVVLHGGEPKTKKHCAYWQFIRQHKDRIAGAVWIKSHMESEAEAVARGFTEEQRLGNHRADALANAGRDKHSSDAKIVEAYGKLLKHIADVQSHMLNTWEFAQSTPEYIERQKQRVAQNQAPRVPKGRKEVRKGPRADYLRIRAAHRAKHKVVTVHNCDVCYDCGRVAAHSLSDEKQTNVWRQECKPRVLFAKVLNQGHSPCLVRKPICRLDAWACTKCCWTSNNLTNHKCTHAAGAARVGASAIHRALLRGAK